jgi:hypothetical protein
MEVFVAGASVRGHGLEGWAGSAAVLSGAASYAPMPAVLPSPKMLSPNERRRASPATRLALSVAEEAVAMSGLAPASLRCVFGSSNGDGATIGAILEALSGADTAVSPTQFHNSVHNAAAGYWSIGVRSTQPATCLGCNDWTVAAAVLKAASEAVVERAPVLLCVYDLPLPDPLSSFRQVPEAFGAALVLLPEPVGPVLGRLRLEYVAEASAADAEHARRPGLDALSRAHPIARILRLMEGLAEGVANRFSLTLLDGRVDFDLEPRVPVVGVNRETASVPVAR